MGCEITSVYNDQVIGKIGLPQRVIQDLIDRDYAQSHQLQDPQSLTKKIKSVYGFTQSFTKGRIFTTLINQVEYCVFSAGRFIIIQEMLTRKQKIVLNKDIISALSVQGKLCLTGLYGGRLLLWDLQFRQIKIDLLLPQGSFVISSVGITPKWLFATDSTQPNNFIYCYDRRTAQLKAYSKIPTLEPVIRSITLNENLHVTACADGIWFMKIQSRQKQFDITKGMFGINPKTSMLCLQRVGDHIVSGGVDGYVYVWQISTFRCVKITSIGVRGKYLIFGTLNGKVKVYTFQVKKYQKKQYNINIQEAQNGQEDVLTFILVDAYQRQGAIFSIATSSTQPLLYFCQTRQGTYFHKWLPAPSLQTRKANNSVFQHQIFQKWNTKAILNIFNNHIYAVYKLSAKILNVDVLQVHQNIFMVKQERHAFLRQACLDVFAYESSTDELVFVGGNGKFYVAKTGAKQGQAVVNYNKSDFDNNSRQIESSLQQISSVQFIVNKNSILLCVNAKEATCVFERQGPMLYTELKTVRYEKIPQMIQLEGKRLVYQARSNLWKQADDSRWTHQESKLKNMKELYGGFFASLTSQWTQNKISAGGDCMIMWQ